MLLLGPIHSVHLARWAELVRGLGLRVVVAGHRRANVPAAVRPAMVDELHCAPRLREGREPAGLASWLATLARRTTPDVIHAHWLPGWGAEAVIAGCRPLVLSAWGSDVYLLGGEERHRAEVAVRGAARVSAPSSHLLRQLAACGVPQDRLSLVDLGVDLALFRAGDPEVAPRARKLLGLGPGPAIFSFRAAQPLYNLPAIVEAFGLLRRDLRDLQLVIAYGSRPPAPEIAGCLEDASRLPGVRVVGDVPPELMPRYFHAADVGVSIPSSDGSPRSVWECLASGRPVVCSDLPQIRERLGRNRAVRLVDPEPRAVADAIAKLLGDRVGADRRAAAARRWAVANADSRVHQRRLRTLYESAAASA